MDKKQAVKVISEAVKIYDNIHCNKNLLIIFGIPNKPSYIETKASVRNFFHLTGVKLNDSLLNDIADKNVNILDVFYSKAMQNKLSIENFDFKDSSTIQKLQVLVNTLKISTNVKMFGDYLDVRINLKTDKIAGSVNSFLGFTKDGEYYIPNTVIAEDLRKNTVEPKKVLAILSKNVNDDKYNTIKMVGKKIDIKRLLEKVSPLVEIDSKIMNEIESRSSQSQPQQQNDNIKQIKFDNPTPQNILHNNSGAAAAVLPDPNPFEKLINVTKNLFKKQDKNVEAAAPVQTNDKTNISENKTIVNESPVSKELNALIEAREAFAAGNLPQAEYEQAVSKYMYSLHGREMWTEAAESFRKQLEECPDNMKKYIGFELKRIEMNIEKKFPPQRQQTLDEIKSAAHEQYVKLQAENKAAEKEIPTNKTER